MRSAEDLAVKAGPPLLPLVPRSPLDTQHKW